MEDDDGVSGLFLGVWTIRERAGLLVNGGKTSGNRHQFSNCGANGLSDFRHCFHHLPCSLQAFELAVWTSKILAFADSYPILTSFRIRSKHP